MVDMGATDFAARSYRKNNNIVTRCIAGQTILVPVTSNVADLNSIFVLNEVGTRIWTLMDHHTTLDRLAEAVMQEYEVESAEASRSILEFVNSLCEAHLAEAEGTGCSS